jgi:osmotically-inducible protein OsmY
MRGIFRTLFVLIVVALIGYVWFGWRVPGLAPAGSPGGTAGAIDTQKARERGAELGEKTAEAAARLKDTVAEAALTTKIKAKMALDDSIKSRGIDVTTNGSTVTLSGRVQTRAQHDRVLALARETEGVTTVVDRVTIR